MAPTTPIPDEEWHPSLGAAIPEAWVWYRHPAIPGKQHRIKDLCTDLLKRAGGDDVELRMKCSENGFVATDAAFQLLLHTVAIAARNPNAEGGYLEPENIIEGIRGRLLRISDTGYIPLDNSDSHPLLSSVRKERRVKERVVMTPFDDPTLKVDTIQEVYEDVHPANRGKNKKGQEFAAWLAEGDRLQQLLDCIPEMPESAIVVSHFELRQKIDLLLRQHADLGARITANTIQPDDPEALQALSAEIMELIADEYEKFTEHFDQRGGDLPRLERVLLGAKLTKLVDAPREAIEPTTVGSFADLDPAMFEKKQMEAALDLLELTDTHMEELLENKKLPIEDRLCVFEQFVFMHLIQMQESAQSRQYVNNSLQLWGQYLDPLSLDDRKYPSLIILRLMVTAGLQHLWTNEHGQQIGFASMESMIGSQELEHFGEQLPLPPENEEKKEEDA